MPVLEARETRHSDFVAHGRFARQRKVRDDLRDRFLEWPEGTMALEAAHCVKGHGVMTGEA